MKKSFLSFAVIALVLSFTSCKETPAESTEETTVEVETPATTEEVEAVEVPVEEVVDTTLNGGAVVEEDLNTTSVE